MLSKSRSTLATALAVAALGVAPALAISDWNVQGSPPNDGRPSATSQSDVGAASESPASDARGEHAAAQSQVSGAIAPDLRTADAREQFVRPVVVEVGNPTSGGFDWTAGIAGLAGGLAIAILAGVGVAGVRRRPFRTVG